MNRRSKLLDQEKLRAPLFLMSRDMVIHWLGEANPRTLRDAWATAPTFGTLFSLLGALVITGRVSLALYLRAVTAPLVFLDEPGRSSASKDAADMLAKAETATGDYDPLSLLTVVGVAEGVAGMAAMYHPAMTEDWFRGIIPWEDVEADMKATSERKRR